MPSLQGKLLGELEDDVDGTMSRLKAATVRAQLGAHLLPHPLLQKKLEQVIKKSGMGCQIGIILCLIVSVAPSLLPLAVASPFPAGNACRPFRHSISRLIYHTNANEGS